MAISYITAVSILIFKFISLDSPNTQHASNVFDLFEIGKAPTSQFHVHYDGKILEKTNTIRHTA